MKHALGSTLLVLSLLTSATADAELVLVANGAPPTATALVTALNSQGRILVANPHNGSVLLEVNRGQELHLDALPRTQVYRQVESYPTSILGAVRIMVEVDSGVVTRTALQDEFRNHVTRWGGREVWRSKMLSRMHFDVPPDALQHVVSHPLVRGFWFNKPGEASLAQSVPQVGVSGYFGPSYWPWGGFYYIAVLDTGVLDGGVLAGRVDHSVGACFSATGESIDEFTGQPSQDWASLCPDGELIESQYGSGAAVPCGLEGCDHGSHVAAVAVSASSPNLGIISVSNVKIMPIQVFTKHKKRNKLEIFDADVARGLDYVLQAGQVIGFKVSAVVLSLKLGGPWTTPCDGTQASHSGYIDALDNFDTAVIAAAGNVFSSSTASGLHQPNYWGADAPACASSAIAVGATWDTADNVAVNYWMGSTYNSYFSTLSHSQLLDYWAPGARISTPVSASLNFGTSFAAPHVAGIWTRLRARYPYESNDFIRCLLADCPMVTDSRSGIPQPVTKPRICWRSSWPSESACQAAH